MRWKGQGILTAVVLTAAVAYGWQWKSTTGLIEELQVRELPIAPYTSVVAKFYTDHQRFPQPGEVVLPASPGGLVRAATLLNDGEIDFTLSAWRVFRGHAHATMAPLLTTGAERYSFALRYVCLDADPPQLTAVVCSRTGSYTRDEVAAKNADALAGLADRRKSDEDRAKRRDGWQPFTTCDRYLTLANDSVGQCIASIDPQLGERFAKAVSERFDNGRRLSPQTIASDPETLDTFNRECEANWQQLVSSVRSARPEVQKCFPDEPEQFR